MPNPSKPRILFVDRLTLTSLAHILFFTRSPKIVWYFEELHPAMKPLLNLFHSIGLMRFEVRKVKHNMRHVKNGTGENMFTKFHEDSRRICATIRRERLSSNPLIKIMASKWPPEKTLLYYETLAEQQIALECIRVGMTAWLIHTQLRHSPDQCVLLIRNRHWFSLLEEYAKSRGIRLLSYGNRISNLSYLEKLCFRQLKFLHRALPSLRCNRKIRSPGDSICKENLQQIPSPPKIGIRYWHRTLSFDPTERSEFFWLEGSGIRYSDVLLYDYISDRPPDDETIRQLERRGIRLLGKGPGIPAWIPTGRMLAVLMRTILAMLSGVFQCLAKGQYVSLYFIRGFLALAVDYAYWYDFYSTNNIRVNIGSYNTRVGQVLALDALNAVSAEFQYSAANTQLPSTQLSAGETVQFLFSPLFRRLWTGIEAPVQQYVFTGFIHDGAASALRNGGRVTQLRKRLQRNGSRFIICYFDENSTPRWDKFTSNEEAAEEYRFFLDWLLADPSLGVVFKPKVSMTLFQRIHGVSELIERAERTGRCLFLTSGALLGSIYPTEAALIADVCVGKVTGTTAALEASLAGVPTVLIDEVGLHSHPLYDWGRGKVVFKDPDSLRSAVQRYRSDPDAFSDFGDWSPILKDFDPFQDGQASLRMSLYIKWIYEALRKGLPREKALAFAEEWFSERWNGPEPGKPENDPVGRRSNQCIEPIQDPYRVGDVPVKNLVASLGSR